MWIHWEIGMHSDFHRCWERLHHTSYRNDMKHFSCNCINKKITLTCNCSIWPFLVWMSSIAEASGQGKQTHPCQVLRSSGKVGAADSAWREQHERLSACTKASLCCFSSSPLTNTPITSNINSQIIVLCCTLINLSDQQTSKYSFHSLLSLVTSDMSFLNIGTCFWSRWTPHHSCVCVWQLWWWARVHGVWG